MSLPTPKVGHVQGYHRRLRGEDSGAEKGYVTAGPFGPHVYLIVDDQDTLLDLKKTRHEAVGRVQELPEVNDYDIVGLPVGEVPMMDIRSIRREVSGWSDL